MEGMRLTIAVDGPASSGKSAVSALLADRLGFAFLSTGVLYRKVARGMLSSDVLEDVLQEVTGQADLFDAQPDLYTQEISTLAAQLSQNPKVRNALLESQRRFSRDPPNSAPGSVVEGRDIATVICPQAQAKFFLRARDDVRAYRRWLDLRRQVPEIEYPEVLAALRERDRQDLTRALSPLEPAKDAHLIDTSDTSSPAEVLSMMVSYLEKNPLFSPYLTH